MQALITAATSTLTLRQCKRGERVRIVGLAGAGPIRRRLMEMGFLPGATVEVRRFAPLADPIEFVLRASHVSLRKAEAEMITVERFAN
ncbi:ferrous iron transport protein A [bacterium]|nr:ferrous iron transport protein A [bacterium]